MSSINTIINNVFRIDEHFGQLCYSVSKCVLLNLYNYLPFSNNLCSFQLNNYNQNLKTCQIYFILSVNKLPYSIHFEIQESLKHFSLTLYCSCLLSFMKNWFIIMAISMTMYIHTEVLTNLLVITSEVSSTRWL